MGTFLNSDQKVNVNSRAVCATDSRMDVRHENELGPSLKTTSDYLESKLFG